MISNESSPIQYLDFEAPIELIQNQIDEMLAMEKNVTLKSLSLMNQVS